MKKENKYPIFCLIIFIAVFAWASANPYYPRDWFLESILSMIAVPILIFTYKKFRFSNTSYTLISIFLILQAIGSHYTYSEVPIDFITQLFDFSRNHYDRLVHFLFGILIYLPILEVYRKIFNDKSKKLITYLAPVVLITALGGLFEVIEWIVAVLVEPDLGTAYLGTQGDVWDAQKDIFLKIISSLLIAFYIYKKRIIL